MKLGIFVSHPIQYFAPLWRRLRGVEGVDLHLYFFSDHSVRGGVDEGFGRSVKWDVPLLEGYPSTFITRDANLSRPRRVTLAQPIAFLKSQQLDAAMVHGYTYGFEWQITRAAKKLGIATLLRGELSDTKRFSTSWSRRCLRDFLLRRFYARIDAFCYVGTEGLKHLKRLGIPESKCFFSPYSVDHDLLDSQLAQANRIQARKDLMMEEGDIVVLFSGKLIRRKRPELLLKSVAKLSNPGVKLVFVGDGPERSNLEALAAQLLPSATHFAGFINQTGLGKYFSASDIFVLPSDYETWGLVVNEAMHAGLPVVVASQVGCHRDLVIQGTNGFVFESGSENQLADSLDRLAADAELRKSMGKESKRRISGYSLQRSAAGIARALSSLVGRRLHE